jgi:putative MFS transporter
VAVTTDELAGAPTARSYLVGLLAFIGFVTLFEGYDLLIINLALPALGREFGVDAAVLGKAVGLINVGTIVAFIPVRLADSQGRRRVFLWAIAGYTLFTLLSALSVGLADFVLWQFLARMCMVTEIGVGAIILTEEMPARWRGAAVTFMFALSLAGGILGSALHPWFAGGELGWRAMYLFGGVVLPVLLLCWPWLRETRRYAAQTLTPRRESLLALFGAFLALWRSRYRMRVLAGASLWFAVNAWSSSCLFFFSYYVTNERQWTPAEVSHALTLAYSLAILGYASGGALLDLVGRRVTASLFFLTGALAAWVCFTAHDTTVITVAYVVVLGMHALWPVAATITSEIFPTEQRATANALVNNLLGRTGMALAPALVGMLSAWLGSVGQAVAVVALVPLVCLPIILFAVSESRGQELERLNG